MRPFLKSLRRLSAVPRPSAEVVATPDRYLAPRSWVDATGQRNTCLGRLDARLDNGERLTIRPLDESRDRSRFVDFVDAVAQKNPYELQGIGQICDYFISMQEGDPEPLALTRFQLRDGNYGAFLADGRLVGVTGFASPPFEPERELLYRPYMVNPPPRPGCATSTATLVDPSWRGRGIAQLLVRFKLEAARAADLDYSSRTDNEKMLGVLSQAAGHMGCAAVITTLGDATREHHETVISTRGPLVPAAPAAPIYRVSGAHMDVCAEGAGRGSPNKPARALGMAA